MLGLGLRLSTPIIPPPPKVCPSPELPLMNEEPVLPVEEPDEFEPSVGDPVLPFDPELAPEFGSVLDPVPELLPVPPVGLAPAELPPKEPLPKEPLPAEFPPNELLPNELPPAGLPML